MPYYLATRDYADRVNGINVQFLKGEPVEVTANLAATLVHAGAVDVTRALTYDEIEQARQRVAETKAEREQTEEVKRSAMREHLLAWGPGVVCPGRRPISAAHHVDELLIQRVDGPSSWWAIACAEHVAWTRARGPFEPPARPDTTPGRYRVAHRYRSHYSRRGVPYGEPVPAILTDTGDITLDEGDVIELPRYLAAWLERDSDGVLQRLGQDGQPIDQTAHIAPSTEDGTAEPGSEPTTSTETTEETAQTAEPARTRTVRTAKLNGPANPALLDGAKG